MKTTLLRLVTVGSACTLTQDGEFGPYFELMMVPSRTQA